MMDILTDPELEMVNGGGNGNKPKPSQQVLKQMFNNGVQTVKNEKKTWHPTADELKTCFNMWQKRDPLPAVVPFIKALFGLE